MIKELEAIFEIEKKLNTATFRVGAEYIGEELELLKQTLTPPTAHEVCKALIDYLQTVYGKVVVYYENKNFGMEIQHSVDETTSHELVSLLSDNIIYIGENLPQHLITMIGRFYEGLEKGE